MPDLAFATKDRIESDRLKGRPECDDCGRTIMTRYSVRKDSGKFICWNCLNDRRVDTAEEFDLEVRG